MKQTQHMTLPSFSGKEIRFLSGKLNRRELLLFLTGRDPDAMNKVVRGLRSFL
jgi:hypothetical protein